MVRLISYYTAVLFLFIIILFLFLFLIVSRSSHVFWKSNKSKKMSSVKTNENIHKKEDGSYYMPTTTPPLPSRVGKAISLPKPPSPRPHPPSTPGNLNNFIKGVRTLRKFRF